MTRVRFCSYVIGAVRTTTPEVGEAAMAALPNAAGDLAGAVLPSLINELAAAGQSDHGYYRACALAANCVRRISRSRRVRRQGLEPRTRGLRDRLAPDASRPSPSGPSALPGLLRLARYTEIRCRPMALLLGCCSVAGAEHQLGRPVCAADQPACTQVS
jgi:hypothetical protein